MQQTPVSINHEELDQLVHFYSELSKLTLQRKLYSVVRHYVAEKV
jgi:hypothetical protein